MAVSIQRIASVAHLPLVLGVLRKLNVAQLTDTLIPPKPRPCPILWPRGRSVGAGDPRWAPCPLQSRSSARRAWDAPPITTGTGGRLGP